MEKALSSIDLYELFENKIKILSYSDLVNYETISEVFGKYDVVFLLYETKENFGHWVVLCQNNTTIFFFDPYGLFPDDQLKFVDFAFRITHNMLIPYLSILLILSPKRVVYNPYQFQDINNYSIATCGRWCSLFTYFYESISIPEFFNMFKNSKIYPDKAITLITEFI